MEEILDICTPSTPNIIHDATIKEMTPELQEKVNILFSSSFKSENFKKEANPIMQRLEPYSFHFSILCLDDVTEFDKTEQMEESKDESSSPYILEFVTHWKKNDIPHLKANKYMMRCQRSGLLIFSLCLMCLKESSMWICARGSNLQNGGIELNELCVHYYLLTLSGTLIWCWGGGLYPQNREINDIFKLAWVAKNEF